MRRWWASIAAFGLAASLVPTVAALGPAAPAGASTGPDYYWRWNDGSQRTSRVVDPYSGPRPPALVVATHPPTPGQPVRLQFRDARGWHTEDAAVTGADGTATVHLNPFCGSGEWCARAFDYRLVAGGRTAGLRVTFRR